MNCSESAHHPIGQMHVKSRDNPCYWLRPGLFDSNRHNRYDITANLTKTKGHQTFCRYLTSVEDYSGRDLRFDEDSLNAFQGILKQLSANNNALNHVWGLAYHGDYSLKNAKTNGFSYSLTWYHQRNSKSPRRRAQFPSWTWAGWYGKVKYDAPGPSIFDYAQQLRFRNALGELIKLEAVQEEEIHPTILNLTAQVVEMTPESFDPRPGSILPWRLHGVSSRLSWSDDSVSEAELCESFQDTTRWQFALIGGFSRSFVMVLKPCPGKSTWQRAWHVSCLSGSGRVCRHAPGHSAYLRHRIACM
jgi:hypothetical protein